MSKVKPVPEGLTNVTVQLSIDGAAEAIEFYKRAFGAEEVMRAPDPSGKKIWHGDIRIGNAHLFVNDVFPDMGAGATKAQLWIYTDNADAAFKRATEAGATAKMPVMDMFWGDRMGQVADKWGNLWVIAQHTKDMTPDEMKKAEQAFVAQMGAQKK